jgi:plasmid stabilization system protein ParE
VRSVAFHPEAQAEFLAAARYYESQAKNLGLDFISAVERTYQRLATFPESGHPFGSRLRRVLVPGFPYGLIYRAELDRLFVVAVAHLHRRPGYWRSRS